MMMMMMMMIMIMIVILCKRIIRVKRGYVNSCKVVVIDTPKIDLIF